MHEIELEEELKGAPPSREIHLCATNLMTPNCWDQIADNLFLSN
jgi:hypothetical protein